MPANCTTSSRRSPVVRRRGEADKPTSLGSTRARRVHKALRSLIAVNWAKACAGCTGEISNFLRTPTLVTRLVERLATISLEFAQWWPRFDVLIEIEGRNQYNHART